MTNEVKDFKRQILSEKNYYVIEETDLDQLHIWSNQPKLWSHLWGWHFLFKAG